MTTKTEALAQPEQEPVAWMCHPFGDDEVEYGPHKECENCIPLYTTPPQSKPLTDDAVTNAFFNTETDLEDAAANFQDGVRFAEADHGIKE